MAQTALKQKIISGVFWQGLERFGLQGVTFLLQIILARLLLPSDFGIIVLLDVFLQISWCLIDSGFSASMVQCQEAEEKDFSGVYWISQGIALLIYLGLFFAAPVIAEFYKLDRLTLLLRVEALSLFLTAHTSVCLAIINRKMQFKKSFFIGFPATLSGGICGVILAFLGYGAWSLVWMLLLTGVFRLFFCICQTHWIPGFSFNRQITKKMYALGCKLLLINIADALCNNVPNFFIGKLFPTAELGFYAKAKKIPFFFANGLRVSAAGPTLSSLSTEQKNQEIQCEIVTKSVSLYNLLLFPILAFIMAAGSSIVSVLLGEKWLPIVPYMRITALSYLFFLFQEINRNALIANGQGTLLLKLEIINKIIFAATFAIGISFGMYGILWSMVISAFAAFVIYSYGCFITLRFGLLTQLSLVKKTALFSAITGICVYKLENPDTASWSRLVLEIFLGAFIYLILNFTFNRQQSVMLTEIISQHLDKIHIKFSLISNLNYLIKKYQKYQKFRNSKFSNEYFADTPYRFGKYTYGIPMIEQYDENCKLTVGNFCSIAKDCRILLGGEHFTRRISTYPWSKIAGKNFPESSNIAADYSSGDVVIGNDVWIGRDVTILSGVHIGNGAVIGAGAVVSKDIPAYAVAVGNPIRILRYRFEKDVIAALENIAWWNWDDAKINKMLPLILSEDPEKLIQVCSNTGNQKNLQFGIVIVVYHSFERIIKYVREELPKLGGDCYTVIVDNDATPESSRKLAETCGAMLCESGQKLNGSDRKIFLINSRENLGYARGNNLGAEFLMSNFDVDYLLFSNDDITIPNGNILPVMADKLNQYPDCKIIGPKIKTNNGKYQPPAVKIVSIYRSIGWNWFPGLRGKEEQKTPDRDCRCCWVSGAFMMVDAKAFEECRQFDKNTFLYYEEAILAERFLQKGYKVLWTPEVEIIHIGAASTPSAGFAKQELLKSACYYYKTYRKTSLPLVYFYRLSVFLNSFWKK